MFFRHTKCFLDIKIDTPSVFLTHQVFLDIKIDSPSVFLTHQVFFRHKNWHPKCFLTHQVFFKVQFPLVSSLLELQSKSWVLELKLEPSALRELSQSCSSVSAFRKGLPMWASNFLRPALIIYCDVWMTHFQPCLWEDVCIVHNRCLKFSMPIILTAFRLSNILLHIGIWARDDFKSLKCSMLLNFNEGIILDVWNNPHQQVLDQWQFLMV